MHIYYATQPRSRDQVLFPWESHAWWINRGWFDWSWQVHRQYRSAVKTSGSEWTSTSSAGLLILQSSFSTELHWPEGGQRDANSKRVCRFPFLFKAVLTWLLWHLHVTHWHGTHPASVQYCLCKYILPFKNGNTYWFILIHIFSRLKNKNITKQRDEEN